MPAPYPIFFSVGLVPLLSERVGVLCRALGGFLENAFKGHYRIPPDHRRLSSFVDCEH
jgi:hypothetical protein